MSEAPRVEKSEDEPLPPSNDSELNEIAWQKSINKNKERDAAHHKKRIQILLFVPLLLGVSAVVWLLIVKK
jgi:hypothetical protein